MDTRGESSNDTPASPAVPVKPVPRSVMPVDTIALARFLLGKLLVRELGGIRAIGRIVETEAYLEGDPACHAYRGLTPRNRSLFLAAGHAYVYMCYGTSFMLNISSDRAGIGCGVLIRALEPLAGIEAMRTGRETMRLRDLARGPGRLTTALQIDRRHDGIDLFAREALWIGSDDMPVKAVGESTRIGLTRGADLRLRYFVSGSDYLSGSRKLNGARS